MYKLDRSAFSMHALDVNEPASDYWRSKTIEERLSAAFYLNSVAYNFDISNPPKMDKNLFSMRKNKD